MKKIVFLSLLGLLYFSCKEKDQTPQIAETETPFVWEGANIYFLLTDRFNNGDPSNDVNFGRTKETGVLRNFMGGDIKGITKKIEEGYFTDLGVNAIWFTPVVEQIHGSVDEGTGNTYGFHGYWAKDWTKLDPNFGTEEDLAELIATAHKNGIRILMDAVINHTGPATEQDPAWGNSWVRTSPKCEFTTYENTTQCTLVANLPDILTESNEDVALPEELVEKWKAEGRLEQEMAELDAFFERTGYPRAPRYYIIKWLTDYIRAYGVDGYRVDTVKHTEEFVWKDLYTEAALALQDWKDAHPEQVLDENDFYMVGEVYNYGISSGRNFDFGDQKVDFYDNGFTSLINFELKYDALKGYDSIFRKYDSILHSSLKGKSTLNYLTSHDDGNPYDKQRTKTKEAATKLLLTQGASQIYYGDEIARPLDIEGTQGDATLRSFMNWEDIDSLPETRQLLEHYQKLGKFRRDHPAVGAGRHHTISQQPYVFSRTYSDADFTDKVVIALDASPGKKVIEVGDTFEEGSQLKDAYSQQETVVKDGKAIVDSEFDIVLLEKKN
ncbi:alpha-amylase [Leptobacterium flavescens]|uniref:Alpha-amylase n=1 Tax=Leptobacterium flavescens TaxID=472055 RepID=A0A6P0UG10_9FLAO|nr:alpha-amylase family glycosyl hydrolase [Leptobacterium flavescens]NER11957.1 alpha-amylase [Leptobacterium flavescens]